MVNLKSVKKVLRSSQTAPQVKDEVAILNDSLRQLESVDALYHPGPYWLRHQQPLVKHIRESGLENFRSGTLNRKDPAYIFRRFGAAEPRVESPSPELSQERWTRQRYETAAEYGRSKGAKPISALPDHRCEDVGPLPQPDGALSEQYRNSIWTRQPA